MKQFIHTWLILCNVWLCCGIVKENWPITILGFIYLAAAIFETIRQHKESKRNG